MLVYTSCFHCEAHADERCPLPTSTITQQAPDYARGFRVQRPKALIEALWDIDIPESSCSDGEIDEVNPASKRVRVDPNLLATPKATPARPSTDHDVMQSSSTDQEHVAAGAFTEHQEIDVNIGINVWGLLDSMGE